MSSVMRPLVRIRPTTADHLVCIARFGGLFWLRETYAGMSRLIPVRDGIPYVADFIFVSASDVYTETDRTQGIRGASNDADEGAQPGGRQRR